MLSLLFVNFSGRNFVGGAEVSGILEKFPIGSEFLAREAIQSVLKCGFLKKSFIMNSPFQVIAFGWVCCCTHPKVMTGNGKLRCIHNK